MNGPVFKLEFKENIAFKYHKLQKSSMHVLFLFEINYCVPLRQGRGR